MCVVYFIVSLSFQKNMTYTKAFAQKSLFTLKTTIIKINPIRKYNLVSLYVKISKPNSSLSLVTASDQNSCPQIHPLLPDRPFFFFLLVSVRHGSQVSSRSHLYPFPLS